MKLLRLVFIALLPACAASTEADATEPVQESWVSGSESCDAGPGEYETACFDEGIGACCYTAAIPHEYEMLEAEKNGDPETAASQKQKLRAALSAGCEGDHEPSCAELDRLDSDAK